MITTFPLSGTSMQTPGAFGVSELSFAWQTIDFVPFGDAFYSMVMMNSMVCKTNVYTIMTYLLTKIGFGEDNYDLL